MFDWNDEELANIIWGEAGESDDHIVPYSEGTEDYHNKKEWGQETVTTRQTEQKKLVPKIDIHEQKQENCAKLEKIEGIIASGFSLDSHGDSSVSNAAKTERTAEIDKNLEVFQNPNEDKDQGNFVDYGWANIGSFDDLDRIFSNEDPIFGHGSLCSSDGLWSSSKDLTNSPAKSFSISSDPPTLGFGALKNRSENLEIKTEYGEQYNQSFTHHSRGNNPVSHCVQNALAVPDHEYDGGKCMPIVKQTDLDMVEDTVSENPSLAVKKLGTPNELSDKFYGQNKVMKGRRKLGGKGEGKFLQNLYDSWSPTGKSTSQFENQLSHSIPSCPPSVVSKQTLHALESLQYQQASNPFVPPSAYGNLTNTYPDMPVLLHQIGKLKHQPPLSGYEISRWDSNPINRSAENPVKCLTMTPREKIEKLRRRQQMQAMLAIQKQQLQFHRRVPCMDHSRPQECPLENQFQYVEGADHELEDLRILPPLNPNSPLKLDDSNTIPMAVDNSPVEETILYMLQDVIAKLDIRIRLCMRDSVFRLAQSAIQRHYTRDTNSPSRSSKDEHEVVTNQEFKNSDRYDSMPNVETETNSIDRTVAYLLFHRPLEISKDPETPKSPVSTKKVSENRNACSDICLPENSEKNKNFFHQRSKSPCALDESPHMDMFKNSPCEDISENISCGDPTDCESMELEASR